MSANARREREREEKGEEGRGNARARDLAGMKKVRVLVIGDSGAGKTSAVRLIARGARCGRDEVERTVGCNVEVIRAERRRKEGAKDDGKEEFFIELWDVGGHAQYKRERGIFYDQINGVIIVHDASMRPSGARCEQWAREVASKGTFSAPTDPTPTQFINSESPSVMYGFGGLPVPCLIVANKIDLEQVGGRRSDVARGFVRRLIDKLFRRRARPILPESIGDTIQVGTPRHERQPSISGILPSGGGLRVSATQGRIDVETIGSFFQELIERSSGDGRETNSAPYVTERILRPKDEAYEDLT